MWPFCTLCLSCSQVIMKTNQWQSAWWLLPLTSMKGGQLIVNSFSAHWLLGAVNTLKAKGSDWSTDYPGPCDQVLQGQVFHWNPAFSAWEWCFPHRQHELEALTINVTFLGLGARRKLSLVNQQLSLVDLIGIQQGMIQTLPHSTYLEYESITKYIKW